LPLYEAFSKNNSATEPTLFLTNICVLKWSGVKHLNWEFPIKIYSQLAGSWFPGKVLNSNLEVKDKAKS